MSQILRVLFQAADINFAVLCGVFYSRYVQGKSSFSYKKASVVKSETHFRIEAIKNSIIDRSWSSAKLLIVQNYTENTNGFVSLLAENVRQI